tara:strand:- start:46 stop:465 length:420 start_codon:yes stop_codon:yes gene_type:complete
MVKIIIVNKSQNVSEEELEQVSIEKIHALLQNNNKEKELKKIQMWEFDEDKVVCYGYISGKEKDINKLELPEPIENNLYYNELVFISFNEKDEELNLSEEEFEDFYDMIFGGFDDIDSEDSGYNFAEDEYEEDGFIIFD